MDSLITKLITDGSTLAIFFVILTILLHIMLIIFKPGKLILRITDYIWILVAFIGLVKLTSDIRQMVVNNYVQNESLRVDHARSFLVDSLKYLKLDACRTFFRTKESPDNFDEIVQDYNSSCLWFKKNIEQSPYPFDTIINNKDYFSSMKQSVSNISMLEHIASIQKIQKTYLDAKDKLQNIEHLKSKADGELLLFYLSPLIICFALSLRLTKVTGDWMLERRKNITLDSPKLFKLP